MNKQLGFQGKIFIAFAVIFLLLIASFSLYLYSYTSSVLIETELHNIAPVVQKISDQIDMFYRLLNTAASSFVSNKSVFDKIAELDYLYEIKDENLNPVFYEKELSNYLNTIYSSVPIVYKVIVFNPKLGYSFIYLNSNNSNITEIPRKFTVEAAYKDLFKRNRYFSLMPPHPDDWSSSPDEVVSLCRKISNPYMDDFGLVEIQVRSNEFNKICSIESDNGNKEVFLFDESNRLVYFQSGENSNYNETDLISIYGLMQESGNTTGELIYNKDSILYSSYKSNFTGWTTVIMDRKISLTSKIKTYRNTIIVISLLIFMGALSIYFFLTNMLIRPLKHLISTLKKVSLDNLSLEVPHGGYDEFKLLNRSFEKMFTKLKDSINKEYAARIREMEALYSSLQAQINPHFIYNTLNVISACCEDKNSKTAAEMCYGLSEMMRYAANSSNKPVSLEDELNHSKYYLELMKLHYDNSLNYEMDFYEGLSEIKLPRLTIQPLIENCINHGFETILPPWIIHISGEMDSNGSWEISIQDNGSGFPQDVLEKITLQISQYSISIDEGELIRELHIGGLGILNTYIRLAIHFGKGFFFTVENLDSRGSVIKFGVRNPVGEV